MKKDRFGKYVKREFKSGRFTVKSTDNHTVTVRGEGVIATSFSVRRAKSLAKGIVRYNRNIGFMLDNERKETELAVSVSSKSQASLEKKYKDI